MRDALGIVEVHGWSPAIVVLDAIDKAGRVRLLQVELNDLLGTCLKFAGPVADVRAGVDRARELAGAMKVAFVGHVIPRPSDSAEPAWLARPENNPLIEQDVVHNPRDMSAVASGSGGKGTGTIGKSKESGMSESHTFAVGMIETQGFTAVIEAIDTACKAANVEVIGREKLGGGYITVIIKGDVAAVKAAIEAGRNKVEGLGKLIAAHVIARPSPAVLSLLPK